MAVADEGPRRRGSSTRAVSTVRPTLEIKKHHEQVFVALQRRKFVRDSHGTIKQRSSFLSLFFLLILIYGVGFSSADIDSDSAFTIVISFYELIAVGLWVLLAVLLSYVRKKRIKRLLFWMLVWLPLLAVLTSILFGYRQWILWVFLSLELLTLMTFLAVEFVYVSLLGSDLFFHSIKAERYWSLRLVAPFTLTYAGSYGRFGKRYTCKYTGQTRNGLPNGVGRWIDDRYANGTSRQHYFCFDTRILTYNSYYGEVITGWWENGLPVAPFVSRQYGTGSTVRALRIAFFLASDDEFKASKLYPSNEQPARCGVASVECSVNGNFFKHLPNSTLSYGPHVVGNGATVADCCSRLDRQQTIDGDHQCAVEIRSDDPRGLQVRGHVCTTTGSAFSKESAQVAIDVDRVTSRHRRSQFSFMPLASTRAFESENVLVPADVEDPFLDEVESTEDLNTPTANTEALSIEVCGKDDQVYGYLDVKDWTRSHSAEALIFFPGFNCCLKESIETLGQFVAMTNLSRHVYPVCFAWPCGQVPTYRHAAAAASTDRNRELFRDLLEGLARAGIRSVHLMSHSLGVQTLMSAFKDNEDGTRSSVSSLFQLDHEFDTGEKTGDDLMILKSVTMLNPDFPVNEFVQGGFLSLRKVCGLISVIGDRTDQALFWSQLINGLCNWMGYTHPYTGLQEKPKKFSLERRIGRNIEMLRVPGSSDLKTTHLDEEMISQKEQASTPEAMFFRHSPPIILSPKEELDEDKWLDLDVIDTTSLDTNIQNLRHSAFNVNPILLKDLEEIILTGRRAHKRSSLLYREGNMYSYCHAPSFVSM